MKFDTKKFRVFGPSAITVQYDALRRGQVYHLPNGIEMFVSDEVASRDRFFKEPETINEAYMALSSIVIRSRL